jgi:superfamily II DNA or RNA helicase
MNKREELQEKAKEEYLKGDLKTLFEISVRFGKTRLAIQIAKELDAKCMVILYPELTIKDAWEDEFTKLNWKPENLIYSTYRSVSKLNCKADFIVGDEINKASHKNLTDLDLFLRDQPRFLGLSGTYSEETKEDLYLYLGLRISHTYTTDKAIEDNIVSDYEIVVKLFEINDKNTYLKKTKNKSWLTTEAKELKYLSKQVLIALEEKKDTKFVAFNRMRWINKCNSLQKTTLKLLEQLRNKRYILYGGSTDFIDTLNIPTYHSKNKKKDNLNLFINQIINKLGLVNLANQGITFPDLDTIVITNINSNSELLFQKLGRSLLQEDNKISKIYIVCSTEEFQRKWLRNSLEGIPKDKIKYIN